MTKDEAITILKELRDGTTYGIHTCDAIDMSIKALKQPDIIRCKDCKYYAFYSSINVSGCWRRGGMQYIDNGDEYCSKGARKEKTDDKG